MDGRDPYYCTLRFEVPDNDKDIRTSQLLWAQGETRSKAREHAAEMAYRFIVNNGLLINIKEAGITPDLEHSINQLQELYQKKYLDTPPEYDFFEYPGDEWHCTCICGGTIGSGEGSSKIRAKKAAAYEVLRKVMGKGTSHR
jgi:ribonuclease-3